MTTGTEMVVQNPSQTLALPSEDQFRRDLAAINKFQQIVHQNLIADLDYGLIPGAKHPSLLKPGAEKIAKLLGLSDDYDILDRSEDWEKPFFRYVIKCRLCKFGTDMLVSSGIGECNSMEAKYRWRWVDEKKLPPGLDKTKLVSEVRENKKTHGRWTVYRFENDDIFTQVNTLLKMAKKRALVDAALSAGRLSELFTQDIEDMKGAVTEENIIDAPPPANKPAAKKTKSTAPASPPPAPEVPEEPPPGNPYPKAVIDMTQLRINLESLQWTDVIGYVREKYGVKGDRVSTLVQNLTPEQQREFYDEVEKRLIEARNYDQPED